MYPHQQWWRCFACRQVDIQGKFPATHCCIDNILMRRDGLRTNEQRGCPKEKRYRQGTFHSVVWLGSPVRVSKSVYLSDERRKGYKNFQRRRNIPFVLTSIITIDRKLNELDK
jgi:hypothetical protein